MVLARTIQLFHPSQSVVHISASFLSVAFVALDFISFVIQLVGGSYAGPTAPVDQQMKGVHIYMGGIGLQQFFICVLIFLAVIFHRQMNQYNAMGSGKEGWKKLLWTLYASLGFISVCLHSTFHSPCLFLTNPRSASYSVSSSSQVATQAPIPFHSTKHTSMH